MRNLWAALLLAASGAAAAQTLNPSADAYVLDGAWANSNFGAATGLYAKTHSQNYDSYLKFDTSSVGGAGSVAGAKVRVGASVSGGGGAGTSIYSVSDTSWSETGITWNNKPARGAALGSITVTSTAFVYYEFDVSNYLIAEKAAGRNIVSFALHNPAASNDLVWMRSREYTLNRPELVIVPNSAPTVSISAPSPNQVFQASATVTVSAAAADTDGTLSQVQFFAKGNPIGTDTSAPYSIQWTNVAAGSYSLTAVATDNLGATTTSAAVNIKVNAAPSVSLTSPANGATFTAPATIPVAATAADGDGTIAKVEFFQGATLIATVTTAPYNFTWTNVAQGSYTITAKATDNDGAATTSAPVTIAVNSGVKQIYYIHPDHLNTPRLIANQAGATVWKWDQQEPFGSTPPNDNPLGAGAFDFPLRLPGQYYDRETAFHYNMMRDYDPSIGRYVESDPIGLEAGLNTYAYVASNPLSKTDTSGLAPFVSVTCPPPPIGYRSEPPPRVSVSPVINCITMTDPVTGRHDLFCDVVPNQFTCRATCVYRRVICDIPIPFMTIEKPGTCRIIDLRPS